MAAGKCCITASRPAIAAFRHIALTLQNIGCHKLSLGGRKMSACVDRQIVAVERDDILGDVNRY